jgi:hypothetical protein
MSVNSQAYYEYRARKARELATAATNPKVAAIHCEMADRYDALAAPPPPRPILRVVAPDWDQRQAVS